MNFKNLLCLCLIASTSNLAWSAAEPPKPETQTTSQLDLLDEHTIKNEIIPKMTDKALGQFAKTSRKYRELAQDELERRKQMALLDQEHKQLLANAPMFLDLNEETTPNKLRDYKLVIHLHPLIIQIDPEREDATLRLIQMAGESSLAPQITIINFFGKHHITNIPSSFFSKFPHLTRISLRHRNIRHIAPDAFSGLHFLDCIDLRDNPDIPAAEIEALRKALPGVEILTGSYPRL